MNCLETSIICPYCAEQISILLDPSVADQEYIEDCQVCCRPIVLSVQIDDNDSATVICHREDE